MDRALELKRAGNRAVAARDFRSAEESFRTLIQIAPDSSDGYLGLAKVYERTHSHAEIVDLLEPVARKMDSPIFHKVLGDAHRVLTHRGQKASMAPAIDHYEAYLRERRDPVTLFNLAELHAKAGDASKALGLRRDSWAMDPGSPSVYAAARELARRSGSESDLAEVESWAPMLR